MLCLRLLILVTLCWTVQGCLEDSNPGPLDTAPVNTSSWTSQSPDLPLAEATFDAFEPILRPTGTLDHIPTEMTITFARPLAPHERTEAESVVFLEPGEVGFLTWTSPQTLKIVPVDVFPPDSVIRLQVNALHTRQGLMKGAIESTFRTPPFELNEARVQSAPHKGTIRMELVFSGPVADVEDIENSLSLDAQDEPLSLSRLDFSPNDARIIYVTAKGLKKDAASVDLRLTDGVRMQGMDATAPPTSISITLPADQATVQISNAELKESAKGWYIKLRCQDPVTKRPVQSCMIPSSALKTHISTTPSVSLKAVPDRSGFRLSGPFPRGPLKLTIPAGTPTRRGLISSTFSQTLEFPQRTSSISFISQGRYAPVDQLEHVPIQLLNVTKAKIRVRRVRPEALVFWASGPTEKATNRTSDALLERNQVFNSIIDQPKVHYINVLELLGRHTQGLFEISVEEVRPDSESPQTQTQRPSSATTINRQPAAPISSDSLRLVVSHLDLIAKRTENSVHVWAIDKHTLAPRSGVHVQLVQASGLVRAEGITGRNGACILDYAFGKEKTPPLEPPFGLIAKTTTDLTYLAFDEVQTPTGEADVRGISAENLPLFNASFWSDKAHYQPGDRAHFLVALWDQGSHAISSEPLELSIVDPRGVEIFRQVQETGDMGVFDSTYKFSSLSRPGRYHIAIYDKSGASLRSESVLVEKLTPNYLDLDIRPEHRVIYESEPLRFHISGYWAFGQSINKQPLTLTCTTQTTQPAWPQWPAHTFGRLPQHPRTTNHSVKGVFNAHGKAQLSCPPEVSSTQGIVQKRVTARVVVNDKATKDEVSAETEAFVFPSQYLIGIQNMLTAEAGQKMRLSGIIVNTHGKLTNLSGTVHIELLSPKGNHLDTDIYTSVAGGKFEAELTPLRQSDFYILRATFKDAVTELKIQGVPSTPPLLKPRLSNFYQTPPPNKPGQLPLVAPSSVAEDQLETVRVHVPFPGRVLFTVETDRVLGHEWRDVFHPTTLDFGVAVNHPTPNIYVSALALRDPHSASVDSFLPARAFQVTSIPVTSRQLEFPIQIKGPNSIRSNSTLNLTLSAPNAPADTDVYVAVIDKRTLSNTDHRPPLPLQELYPKRALDVQTFDTIGWNLNLTQTHFSSRTGGDISRDIYLRSPSTRSITLWSGRHKLDKNGQAEVKFDIPEYQGQLKVMATAFGPRQIGHAEHEVQVKDPLLLRAHIPQMLTVGDKVDIPVQVINQSSSPQRVTLSMDVSDVEISPGSGHSPARQEAVHASKAQANENHLLIASPVKTATLAAGEQTQLWFNVSPKSWVPKAKIRISMETPHRQTSLEGWIQYRPVGTITQSLKVIKAKAGKMDLSSAIKDWVPNTLNADISLTHNPFAETSQSLAYVLNAPFGNAEQTASKIRALLVSDRFFNPILTPEKRTYLIEQGLERLTQMQQFSGGFGLWPTNGETSPWVSAYIIDTWLDLKANHITVPKRALERATGWIQRYLRSSDANLDAAPYLHFVLAKAQRPQHEAIQTCLTQLEALKDTLSPGQIREAQFLLRAAQYIGGDRRTRPELMQFKKDLPQKTKARSGFYSEHRRRGLELTILVELFGPQEWLRSAIQSLASQLTRPDKFSAQELAWTLTALARFVNQPQAKLPDAVLKADDHPISPAVGPTGATSRWTVTQANKLELEIQNLSKPKPFVVIHTQGVKTSDTTWKAGGKGLSIERSLIRPDGTIVNPQNIQLGEVVYSKLTLTNTQSGPIHHVAMMDLIPNGFEILPNLDHPSSLYTDTPPKNLWVPDYTRISAGALEAYGHLSHRSPMIYYVPMRATISGHFKHPPVSLQATYNPNLRASSDSTSVKIMR